MKKFIITFGEPDPKDDVVHHIEGEDLTDVLVELKSNGWITSEITKIEILSNYIKAKKHGKIKLCCSSKEAHILKRQESIIHEQKGQE